MEMRPGHGPVSFRGRNQVKALNKKGGSGKEREQGHRKARRLRDDLRDYLAGLRSWGLRHRDLVKVTGAGSYVDYWRPEPGDAE